MGYSTDFYGKFEIVPPLNEKEISFLQNFSETRRVVRNVDSDGRYYITDGKDEWGQKGSNILNMNDPPIGQPSLWCGFTVSENGKFLLWNGGEKTYSGAEWINYIIVHFLGNNPLMEQINPELYEKHEFSPHLINGLMYAKGEEFLDLWKLEVKNNFVYVQTLNKEVLPEGFQQEDEDPDSEDDDETDYEKKYEKWTDLREADFRKFTYNPKELVDYETNDYKELSCYDIQNRLRLNFSNNYQSSITKVNNIFQLKK